MVPRAGLEPARDCSHRILSPVCLPFHHQGSLIVTIFILSYFLFFVKKKILVPKKGFEPSTLRVWTACSSQLSYLGKLVAGAGFEPTTFGLWARRATMLLYPAIFKWCLGPGSNRHGNNYHRILSPVRLPISPPRHFSHWQMLLYNKQKSLSSIFL